MPEIPLGSIDRIIRKSGTSRVNLESSFALREILEEIGNEISTISLSLSKHRNQQIVTKDDIRLAYSMYKEKMKQSGSNIS